MDRELRTLQRRYKIWNPKTREEEKQNWLTVTSYYSYDSLFFTNLMHKLFTLIQGESLARGPKLLSMYTVEERGFLFRKYWQTGSFKACQTAFRTEFGERRAPSKCCIQKLVKKLKTRGI